MNEDVPETSAVKIMKEIVIVDCIVRQKIVGGDESFTQWLTNEITALALPLQSRPGTALILPDNLNASNLHALVDVVKQYAFNEFVQRDALKAFADLTHAREDADDFRVAVAEAGGIQIAFEAMSKFPKNDLLQVYGWLALGNLACNNSDNRAAIARLGGIELVLRAMTTFANDGRLQRSCSLLLANMALLDEHSRTIASQGGIELVISAMSKFPHYELVLRNGCHALANLTSSLTCIGHDNRVAIGRQGGIELVIQAMKKFPNENVLQECACCALGNFSYGVVNNRITVTKCGGIGLVKLAMDRFRTNGFLQAFGCGVLGSLASRLVEREGETCVGLVIRAMKTFPSNTLVHRNGCFALESWAGVSLDCRRCVEEQDGVNLARHAWRAVLSEGCKIKLETEMLSLPTRFIFDDEFLSKHPSS